MVVAVNDKGREWGIKAGDLVRVAAQVLGGGGGGKDDVAQGGGTDPAKVDEALRQVEHVVGQRVTGVDVTAVPRTAVRGPADEGRACGSGGRRRSASGRRRDLRPGRDARHPGRDAARGGGDLEPGSTRMVTEREAVEVVVGLPTTLRGPPGPAAEAAEAYAGALAGRLATVPVRLVDERLLHGGRAAWSARERGRHAQGA